MNETLSKELATAILAVQKEAPTLRKDATNPHFGSSFVSLDNLLHEILPVLHKHGLALMQAPSSVDGKPALTTMLIHAGTGDRVESDMLLMQVKDDPQAQGSALTYARRYALTALLGLSTGEDDDGNSAVSPSPTRTPVRSENPAERARAAQEPAHAPTDGKNVAPFTIDAIFGPNNAGWYDLKTTDGHKFSTKKQGLVAGLLAGDSVMIEWTEKQNGQYVNRYLESAAPLPSGSAIDESDIPFAPA